MIVKHASGNYEITLCSLADAVSRLPGDVVFVTDENVDAIYRPQLRANAIVLAVTPGERSKGVETWGKLHSELARLGSNRRTTIVALGGGVIGDLAGFVAATYMRGVPLVQIPTSLLAQVDSSVGGKVGIDLPEGKNLVGGFYPPQQVFICLETLDTLPPREFSNGMAEVWKYGFILDAGLVEDLQGNGLDRATIVRRCIELKKRVVEVDERETTGERAKLNFGHTVGHAIEKLTGYSDILHGEAISIGMVAEAALGEALGVTTHGVRAVVEECLRSQGLPTTSVVLRDVDMLIETMKADKKSGQGRLAFSLLASIGSCRLIEDVSEATVRTVLREL